LSLLSYIVTIRYNEGSPDSKTALTDANPERTNIVVLQDTLYVFYIDLVEYLRGNEKWTI